MGKLLRHRQTKGPVSARLSLNCRATPRLHRTTDSDGGSEPGGRSQSGEPKATGQQPTAASLVLALHRLCLRSRQRLCRLARGWRGGWRNRRGRSNYGNGSFADLNRSLFAVHRQARAIASDRTAGARLLVVILNFDLVEVARNLSFARECLYLDRRIRRNRNPHVAFAVIDLNIPRLVQSDLDRQPRVWEAEIARQALQRDIFGPGRQAHRS